MELKVDIRKRLGSFELISDFTVDHRNFALLGTSGSGKSLTLKCIAGIMRPDSGRIVLGDRVLFDSDKRIDLPSRKRRVGYLFQNYALFPNMTVSENILATAKDKDYALSLIAKFGLDTVVGLYPRQLSGGQSQRTALARMLAAKPEAILMDEPFSALDNYVHTMIEREIMDVLDEFDGPSILVSHDRNEVFRLCERICVIEAGRTYSVQERDDFFDRPLTVTAARLTGCKNITAITADGLASDWGIRIASDKIGEHHRFAAYRAHYFKYLNEEAAAGRPNVFRAQTVRVIEDTFSMNILFRQAGNKADTADSLLTWVTDKNNWETVRGRVESGTFYLELDPSQLILLEN